MSDYVVKFEGRDNLSKPIANIKKEVEQVGRNASQLDKITQKFDKIQSSTAPLKRQLADVKKLMAEMNFNGMSGTEQFTEMAAYAGQLKDAISDASTAVNRFANDTMMLQGAVQGFQMISAAATVTTGVMGLFGAENENVQQAILKVQSALAVLNGIQVISNALNKDSALIQAMNKLAMIGSAITTETFTAALTKNAIVETLATAKTKIATVAQTAWNVAKAIGMAIVGNYTGLILLAAAGIATYALATSNSTDEEKKNTEAKREQASAIADLHEIHNNYYDKVGEQSGQMVGKFQELAKEYANLKTEGEKVEWLERNRSLLESLGLSVYDVITADKVFITQNEYYIKALELRAKKLAILSLRTEEYQRHYKELLNLNNSVAGGGYYKHFNTGDDFAKHGTDTHNDYVEYIRKKHPNVNWDEVYDNANGHGNQLTAYGASLYNEAGNGLANERMRTNTNKLEDTLKRNLANIQKLEDGVDEEIANFAKDVPAIDMSGAKVTSRKKSGGGNNKQQSKSTTAKPDKTTEPKEVKPEDIPGTPEYLRKLLDKSRSQLDTIKKNYIDGIIDANAAKTQMQKLNDELEQWNKQGKNMPLLKCEFEVDENNQRYVKEVFENDPYTIAIDPTITPNSIEEAKSALEEIEKMRHRYITDDVDDAAAKALADYYNTLQTQWEEKLKDRQTRAGIKTESVATVTTGTEDKYFSKGSRQDKRESHSNAQSRIEQIKSDYKLNIIDADTARTEIDEINNLLQSIGLDPITLTVNDDGTITSALEDFELANQKIGTINDAVDTFGSAFQTLGSAMDGAAGDALSMAGTVMQAIAQILPQIGSLTGAALGQSLAEGTSSAAALPFPANLGAIATIVATIASVAATAASMKKKFADGGIVMGSTHHGDKILAGLNAGEMVLNQSQQANLYHTLKNGSTSYGKNTQLEFVLRGSTLHAAFKNYQNKINKQS